MSRMSKEYGKGNSCVSNRYDVVYPKLKHQQRNKRNKFWLKRYCLLFYLRLLRLRGKPKILSRGLAAGVFAGFFPLFGLQIIFGVFLATLLHGSKVAAVAGTWISNPLTYLPIYLMNYKVGKLLLGVETKAIDKLDLQSFSKFLELGSTVGITLLFGCFVVGSIGAFITYFATLYFLQSKSNKKK